MEALLCRKYRNSTAVWCPDGTLSDENCFQRIEAIVRLLEDLGIDCGDRHDF